MFVGVSKSLGGGLRIGVGKRIGGGTKKPSSKELQTAEFQQFLHKVENDLNEALQIFIVANGEDFYQLLKDKTDIDELFKDNAKYKEFITLYNNAKYEIEKILYTGDSGVVSKRSITEIAYTVKDFINLEYPNITLQPKPKGLVGKVFSFIWKTLLGFFILIILIGIFNNTETEDVEIKNIENKSIEKITTKKE